MQATEDPPATGSTPLPLNRIRVETALSRFPIHRLAKKDNITIDLQQTAENGEADFKWEVTYTQKHGQPGPLAYKVDTLIVNRRIDESGRPLPRFVKLGSLTELCAALGIGDSGENRANLRKALHQNASAYITAKIRYRTKTGKERWSEIGYSRYSVVFTGEKLPDGSEADAVYILPNPSYADLLNHVEVRPLDYDYLMQLAPGSQRFYELVSFQIYGALASGRPRAKMLYSEYCDHAPQVRYPDFDRVKKQMYKIHVPHRQAGYIMKVEYQETTDADGVADWEMFYSPGPKAIAEFEAFTRRQIRRIEVAPLPVNRDRGAGEGTPVDQGEPALLPELTGRGIAANRARELLANLKPGQELMDQLEYVDSIVARDTRRKLENPPGLYITYIRDNVAPPADFPTSRKRRLHEQARQTWEAKQARAAQVKLDYEAHCAAELTRYLREEMPTEEYERLAAQHRRRNAGLFSHMTDEELDRLTEGTVRSEVQQSGRVRHASFEEFLAPGR
jgi:hypothetical protein